MSVTDVTDDTDVTEQTDVTDATDVADETDVTDEVDATAETDEIATEPNVTNVVTSISNVSEMYPPPTLPVTILTRRSLTHRSRLITVTGSREKPAP